MPETTPHDEHDVKLLQVRHTIGQLMHVGVADVLRYWFRLQLLLTQLLALVSVKVSTHCRHRPVMSHTLQFVLHGKHW